MVSQSCDVQGIYNVLLWSRPDVLESIFNKAVSVKKRGREIHASSVRRIIFKILLAFEQSPLSQEDNDSMQYAVTGVIVSLSLMQSHQGLLFLVPFSNVVGGGKGVAKSALYFYSASYTEQSAGDTGISGTAAHFSLRSYIFKGEILKWSAITHCDPQYRSAHQEGLFVPVTGSVWQFWQPALLWKCGLIHGRRCTAHDNSNRQSSKSEPYTCVICNTKKKNLKKFKP